MIAIVRAAFRFSVAILRVGLELILLPFVAWSDAGKYAQEIEEIKRMFRTNGNKR